MLSSKPALVHHARLWQFVVALAEALQANREADAFFGRPEDDEDRGLAGAQLLEQIVIHDHLGNAATRQAADEAGAPNIGLGDLEPEPGGKQHAHGAMTRMSRLFWSAVLSITVRPTLGRSSAMTVCMSAHCSSKVPGGVSQRTCQSLWTDLTRPCALACSAVPTAT